MANKKTFQIPIYDIMVSLYKKSKDWEKATGITLTSVPSGIVSGSYMWINPDYIDANTIAHESYHVVISVLEHIGIDHSKDEETVAYLLGYIVERVTKFYMEDK